MHVKHYCSAYRNEWWLVVRWTMHCPKGHPAIVTTLQERRCCRLSRVLRSHCFTECLSQPYPPVDLKKTRNPKRLVPGVSAKKEIWKPLSFDFQPITLYLVFVSQFCLPTYAHRPAWYLWRCRLHLISVFALPDLVSRSLLISPPDSSSSPDLFRVLALVPLQFFWT